MHKIFSQLKGFILFCFTFVIPYKLLDNGVDVVNFVNSNKKATGNGESENHDTGDGIGFHTGDGMGNGEDYGDLFSGDGSIYMTDFVFEEANA
jgi:hypothetical protein